MNDPFLDLFSIIEDRKKSKSKKSYTLSLFKEGEKKIAQKFGEESAELIIDFLKGTKNHFYFCCISTYTEPFKNTL